MYDKSHEAGVVHVDVEKRHVIGPTDDVSKWRIIDFDHAQTFTESDISQADTQKLFDGEKGEVSRCFEISPALWSFSPRRMLDIFSVSANSGEEEGGEVCERW